MTAEIPAAPERSSIPKSMGILLIIFASLYLLSSLATAVSAFLGSSIVEALPIFKSAFPKLEEGGINLEKIVEQLKPMYMLQGGEKLATAAISGFGLFAGIKLVQYQAAGLRLAVWWAITALSYLVIEIMLFFIFVQPLIHKFLNALTTEIAPLLGDDKASFELLTNLVGNAGAGGVIGGALFMAVFPILMLALMNTHAARKSCCVDKVFG